MPKACADTRILAETVSGSSLVADATPNFCKNLLLLLGREPTAAFDLRLSCILRHLNPLAFLTNAEGLQFLHLELEGRVR